MARQPGPAPGGQARAPTPGLRVSAACYLESGPYRPGRGLQPRLLPVPQAAGLAPHRRDGLEAGGAQRRPRAPRPRSRRCSAATARGDPQTLARAQIRTTFANVPPGAVGQPSDPRDPRPKHGVPGSGLAGPVR